MKRKNLDIDNTYQPEYQIDTPKQCAKIYEPTQVEYQE